MAKGPCSLGVRVRLATAIALAGLILAACSSGSTASPETTQAPALITSTPSTTAASTTTVSLSTSTSTVAPAVVAAAMVRAAVDRSIAAFRSCLQALPNCDVGSLAATRAGTMLDRNTARINEWNAAGYALRQADQFRYVIEQVALGPDLRQATVTVCSADGSQLVKPGAGPGGADVIVDGAYTSGRAAWDMRLDPDGVWRPYDSPAISATESRDVCPAT